MQKALEGVRILDLTRLLPGPFGTLVLSDLGARVDKVEDAGAGDYLRHTGPQRGGMSLPFAALNRGKRSAVIDLKNPAGRDAFLLGHYDVLFEQFRPGVLDRLGLGHASLREAHPRLVICALTGYGQTGPLRDRAGHDLNYLARAGVLGLQGPADGPPQTPGFQAADVSGGMWCAIAILAALRHRDATGEGQHIDMSLLDVQVATLANQAMNYLATGTSPRRLGNAHPSIVPYQAFATSDGHVILAVGNDGQFARFCEVAGAPGLATDPRFATNPERVRNRDVLIPVLQGLMSGRSMDDWITALTAASVPVGPINTIERVFADPHVQSRGLQTNPSTPEGDKLVGVASPLKLSRTPAIDPVAAPELGADSLTILSRLLDPEAFDVTRLIADGIIAGPGSKPPGRDDT